MCIQLPRHFRYTAFAPVSASATMLQIWHHGDSPTYTLVLKSSANAINLESFPAFPSPPSSQRQLYVHFGHRAQQLQLQCYASLCCLHLPRRIRLQRRLLVCNSMLLVHQDWPLPPVLPSGVQQHVRTSSLPVLPHHLSHHCSYFDQPLTHVMGHLALSCDALVSMS